MSFNFIAANTVCSDFGAQEKQYSIPNIIPLETFCVGQKVHLSLSVTSYGKT